MPSPSGKVRFVSLSKALFLILFAFVWILPAASLTPERSTLLSSYHSRVVSQSQYSFHPRGKDVEKSFTAAPTNNWTSSKRIVIPGSLIEEVIERRADLERNSRTPIYLIPTKDLRYYDSIECTSGNGGFWGSPIAPALSYCLPLWLWPLELLGFSTRSFSSTRFACSDPLVEGKSIMFPQCKIGYHCDSSIGKCIQSPIKPEDIYGSCPDGLVWSSKHQLCVECLGSKYLYPKKSSQLMPPFYFSTSYTCNDEGKVVPPFAVSFSEQLFHDPSATLKLLILIELLIVSMIKVGEYVTRTAHRRVNQSKLAERRKEKERLLQNN